jgi:hypothetical protein
MSPTAAAPVPTGAAGAVSPEESDDRLQVAQRQTPAEPGRYDKVSPPPFLAIRHLLSQNSGQANLAHPRALQHALPLQQWRSRNDQHVIASALAAGFEQKRYIQHRETLATGARTC